MVRTDEPGTTPAAAACAAMILHLFAIGCGSASQSVTGPSSAKCGLTVTADTSSFPPDGGNGHITVATNRECRWTASASSGWIQLNGNTSGQGEARIPFVVGANADPAERRGAVTVGDQQVAITQEAAPCQFVLEPAALSVPASGGRGSLQVRASSPLCSWTARSEVAWLTIVDGAQGPGSGQIVYDVQAADGPSRSGSLTVAGLSVPVTQGEGCAPVISPSAHNVGAAGGSGVVTVAVGEGCPWSAASPAPWITITSEGSGSGTSDVRFTVSANTSPERTATLTVAGHPVSVTQASGCTIGLAPSSQAFAASGGSGSIGVTAGPGCPWSASPAAGWITVTSGSSGTGGGDARFSVAANTGPERTGTIAVGGGSFVVSQASGCSVSIAPESQPFGLAGGSGTVNVTVGAGCPWTATASAGWVQVTAGGSGTGTGVVTFAVAPNTGPARQASLTIGGRTFAIQQEVGCTFTLSAPGMFVEAGGGGGTVTVQTADGCIWSASSGEPWIQISSGQTGVGTGPVHFVVAPNDGSERSGTLTAGGQSFYVRQAGGRAVSIMPAGQAFAADGGTGATAGQPARAVPGAPPAMRPESKSWKAGAAAERGRFASPSRRTPARREAEGAW
jgi:hypothetical protein